MENKHNHCNCNCKHENLKWCPVCNVVYCEKCGEEWKQESPWTWTYPSGTGTYIGTDTLTTTGDCSITCNHK